LDARSESLRYSKGNHVFKLGLPALISLVLAAPAIAAEARKEAQPDPRKFPLERCDQLKDKARMACLEKARAEILDARRQRTAAGEEEQPKGRQETRP
jgi:hypothetical protein